jgi:hypothetical protein
MASKLQVTAAECRRRAADCHKMAENAPSPHVRDTLADIQRMWNRLALKLRCRRLCPASSEAWHSDLIEIAVLVGAYQAGLKELTGRNDVAAELLAQAIVTLAERGERDPIRLRQQAVEIVSGKPSQA